MKVVAIIQARMDSTRLPGKILKKVLNRPLLAYQLERLKRCRTLDEIVVATTVKASDNAVVEFCKQEGVAFYRGSEEDVLSRYYEAAREHQSDVVVRITSDCPVIDPVVVDKVIKTYLENPIYDYVSNTLVRSYPRGMDTSLVPFTTLKQVHEVACDLLDREHVTRYIYQRPDEYKLLNVANHADESKHRWTVDTSEDYELVSRIIETLYPTNPQFSLKDILDLLSNHREWIKINEHVEQKKD